MRRLRPKTLFVFLLIQVTFLSAQESGPVCQTVPIGRYTELTAISFRHPTLGIALSGGGARGFAQIGVLQELERNGISVDYIAGSSMGAIIGGLYAMGYSAGDIENLAKSFDWDSIIRTSPERQELFLSQKAQSDRHLLELHFNHLHLILPTAYSNGQAFTSLLTELMLNAPHPMVQDFDACPIPFRAMSTDLVSGQKVVLDSGSLVDAMRASMAIPLLFTPVQIGDQKLLDGGLLDNLPSKEVRDLGADVVLSVDTSSPLHQQDQLETPWVLADQVTTIMMQRALLKSHESSDLIVKPVLGNYSNLDFSQIDSLIESGRQSIQSQLPYLQQKLYPAPVNSDSDTTLITIIPNVETSSCSPELLADLTQWPGQMLESEYTARLLQLSQYGEIRSISTSITQVSDTLLVNIDLHPPAHHLKLIGFTQFSDSTVKSLLSLNLRESLDTRRLKQGLTRLQQHYQQQGFCVAAIDTVYLKQDTLVVSMDEGRFKRLEYHGLKYTNRFVIDRELACKKDSLLTRRALLSSLNHIYSTGYFDEVRLGLVKNSDGYTLQFFIKEKDHAELRLGLQYDTERRLAGFFELMRDNLLGQGIQGSIIGVGGHLDAHLTARFMSHRLLKSYWTVALELAQGRHRYNYYKEQRYLGQYDLFESWMRLTIGHQMGRLGTVSMILSSEDMSLKPFQNGAAPQSAMQFNTLGIRSEVDSRDRYPFATQGMHHLLEYETAATWAGNKEGYTKFSSLIESYHSPYRSWTLHPRLFWGSSDLTTPYHKQYKLGGFSSFPALPAQSLVGRRFIILTGEIQCHLSWPVWLKPHLSIRGDLAGAWLHYDAVKAEDFNRALTATLAADTFLGPLYLSYSRLHTGRQSIFLSVGHRFPYR